MCSQKNRVINLKVFNMIKGINKSKAIIKHISFKCTCEFDGRKCNPKIKNNNKCQSECKKPI